MVTKTITIEDEVFVKINELVQQNEMSKFSGIVNLLLKRGLAYSKILEDGN